MKTDCDYQRLNSSDERPEKDPFTESRYRQFVRYLPTMSKVVLDVGCNAGRGGMVLRRERKDLQLIGLDCVTAHLKKIPSDIYQQLLCCSATSIALDDASVDAVVAGEFIEHIYAQDVAKTLQECWRVLRKGGRLLLTTPNPDFLLLKARGKSVLGGPHVSQHNPRELIRLLHSIGFCPVKIAGSGRVSSLLGEHFPVFSCYGSYLALADKPADAFPNPMR